MMEKNMNELMVRGEKVIMGTYKRFPVVLVKGSGCRVWDSNGKEYLDMVAGIAVCSLGHCHPKVTEAIKRQLDILIHVSNLYYIEPQIRLGEILTKNSFADKVFFCNSGAEANEAAIKLARRYSFNKYGENRYEIITMLNSFHGRTLATLAATGQKKFREGFEPLPPGFSQVPYDDLSALEKAITNRTCAVMLEPIQGEGGVIIPHEDYLKGVRKICDKYNILLIFDEVQTGMGRTGTLWAYEQSGIEPDILTVAKALGSGFPIGALLAKEEVAEAFSPGSHASTFGGNPLAASAALATLEILMEEKIIDNCKEQGAYLLEKLRELKSRFPSLIKDVRGKGLIAALELTVDGDDIVHHCLEKGLLINCTNTNILRFIPPLVITKREIEDACSILVEVLTEK